MFTLIFFLLTSDSIDNSLGSPNPKVCQGLANIFISSFKLLTNAIAITEDASIFEPTYKYEPGDGTYGFGRTGNIPMYGKYDILYLYDDKTNNLISITIIVNENELVSVFNTKKLYIISRVENSTTSTWAYWKNLKWNNVYEFVDELDIPYFLLNLDEELILEGN